MNFTAIAPEIMLVLGALTVLLINIFSNKKNCIKPVFSIALITILISIILTIYDYGSYYLLFNKMININHFSSLARVIILLLSFMTMLISYSFLKIEKDISAEFIVLIFMSVFGSLLLISSNDLLAFYISLEVQTLPLYILAAIQKKSIKSSESGIKYFILGSTSSAILLFGISIIYGFTATTNFGDIYELLQHDLVLNNPAQLIALKLGFILLLVGVLFKVSSAPFHMWSPDVYEGTPTIVTIFMASLIKFASIIITIKICGYIFDFWKDIEQVIIICSILSLVIGSLGAIKQSNLKRLLAYSGIGHVGFVLASLSSIDPQAVGSAIFYAIFYTFTTFASFSFIYSLRKNNNLVTNDKDCDIINDISSLSGIAKTNPLISLFIAILMLSMAGIPPMIGFFAKFNILLTLMDNNLTYLAIIAVLTSVVSAFYYLRVVKMMYFVKPKIKSLVTIDGQSIVAIILGIIAFVSLFSVLFINHITLIIQNTLF